MAETKDETCQSPAYSSGSLQWANNETDISNFILWSQTHPEVFMCLP